MEKKLESSNDEGISGGSSVLDANENDRNIEFITQPDGIQEFIDYFEPHAEKLAREERNNKNWVISFGAGSNENETTGIRSDLKGNTYISGTFSGINIPFGTKKLSTLGKTDIFLMKLDIMGNIEWSISFGSIDYDTPTGLRISASGHLYLSGSYREFIKVGQKEIPGRKFYSDSFVAKLDTKGNVLWSMSINGSGEGSHTNTSFEIDSENNLYITGYFGGTTLLKGKPITPTKKIGHYTAKINASGSVDWAIITDGGGNIQSHYFHSYITMGKSNYLYVTGKFEGQAKFGKNTINSLGKQDIFLMKIGLDGNIQWVKATGGSLAEDVKGISIDPQGNIYVIGNFSGKAFFGKNTLESMGSTDIFIYKINPSGDILWAKSFGGEEVDEINDITIDDKENIFITGFFVRKTSLGNVKLISSSIFGTCFVSRLDTNGNIISAISLEGTAVSLGRSLLSNNGILYLSGLYSEKIMIENKNLIASKWKNLFVWKSSYKEP